jgi:hypothetical protein
MSYADNRIWSDRFIPHICEIVGPRMLEPSSISVDQNRVADLIIVNAKPTMTIACRVRRPGYAERFPWDFTLRSKLDSGAKTELDKIIEGFGDWMLYGHAGDYSRLARWLLIDLRALRAAMISPEHNPRSLRHTPNGDGTYFVSYNVRTLPPSVVIDSSHLIPRRSADLQLAMFA